MRLFFAIDITEQDKDQLAIWQEKLSHENDNQKNDGHKSYALVDKNNFHITLSFLGQVTDEQYQQLIDKADQLAAQISLTETQTIELDHLRLFKKPKVLYLGLAQTPNWLAMLAEQLKQKALSLKIFQEARPYCPHITLARKAKVLPEVAPLNIKLTVNSFSLYQSISTASGVKYRPIKTWQLS